MIRSLLCAGSGREIIKTRYHTVAIRFVGIIQREGDIFDQMMKISHKM